jgi:hypothetical protein
MGALNDHEARVAKRSKGARTTVKKWFFEGSFEDQLLLPCNRVMMYSL